MSFLAARFYDRFMANVENACLREWRRELLGQIEGVVLEIGAGTGANIECYSDRVTRLVLAEPDRHMRKRLEKQASRYDHVHVSGGTAEATEADDESFDHVVTSLVCCSIRDLSVGLREFRRVLKPGGSLVFLEHVAAADGTSRRLWQNRINPVWRALMGGCHLNRDTEQAMLAAGFEITRIKRENMCKAPTFVQPTIRGIARKSG